MYGLEKDTDLTFLLRKQLERVDVSEYQAQLHFTGSICISVEGECELDKQRISYEHLTQLVGNTVFGVLIQDDGATMVVFVNGQRLNLLDSNSNYESYQITAPGVTIIV